MLRNAFASCSNPCKNSYRFWCSNDIRNKHIAVEEEVPPLDDAAAHDRARKAAHDT